jgi:phenylalanyl-tRNA synthetase beta chain
LTLLDEREVTLDEDFLVIADARGPLALAGVMGGHAARVTDTTRDVFLEAAHFSPPAINGRARRLGLHTDAAHRFERGVDAGLPSAAMERATALLVELAGGSAGPITEAVSEEHLPQRRPVRLRRERLARVLGLEVPPHEVARILIGLGMELAADAEGWFATPPGARFDVSVEEDLIEEVARIHGYENIEARPPQGELPLPVLREDRVDIAALREQLVARDYNEAITYAFVAGDLLETWGLADGRVALANPLSADLAVMRTSLLPGLVAALESNRNRQQSRVRLFEVGRSYRQMGGGPVETLRIAGVVCGPVTSEQWGEPRRDVDFFDIKGDVEALVALTGAGAREFEFEAGGPAWLHAGRGATLRRGDRIAGYVGALSPRLQHRLDLADDVYVFDLEVDILAARSVPAAHPVSRFPSLRRDIAMLLPQEVTWARVEACVRSAVGACLAQLVLFDRYAGPNLETGTKSLAMGLILQDRSRTLTDQDADRCVALAVAALESECKGKLRG